MWRLANNTLISKILLKVNLGRAKIWISRKGIIFWATAIQKKWLRLIFSTIPINHMWKGAAPSFIIATKRRTSLNIKSLLREIIKTTELKAWNMKYLTTWEFLKLCWYRSKIIIKLNILISILNQIMINEFEVSLNKMLRVFIKKAKTVNKGEMLIIITWADYAFLNLQFSTLSFQVKHFYIRNF